MVVNIFIIIMFGKVLLLAVLALAASAKLSLTDFGHLASVTETADTIHKEITVSRQNVYNSYSERYRYIKEADA